MTGQMEARLVVVESAFFNTVAFVANGGSLCTCIGNVRQKLSIEELCHKDAKNVRKRI